MSGVPVTKKRFDEWLPIELRLRIWRIASFFPRNVDVWSNNIFISKHDEQQAYLVPHQMISRRPIPVVLHICHESRVEALKHYVLAFGTTEDVEDFVVTARPKIYINPVVDTVSLPRPDSFLSYTSNVFGGSPDERALNFAFQLVKLKLKSLAINVVNTEGIGLGDGTMASEYGDILPTSGDALEELILFSDSRCYDYPEEGNRKRVHHDMIKFRELVEDDLETDLREIGNSLVQDLGILDAYFSPTSDLCEPEGIARYKAWKKVLCRVDGKFENLEFEG